LLEKIINLSKNVYPSRLRGMWGWKAKKAAKGDYTSHHREKSYKSPKKRGKVEWERAFRPDARRNFRSYLKGETNGGGGKNRKILYAKKFVQSRKKTRPKERNGSMGNR